MCGALIGMSEKKGDRCYHIDWKNKRCYYSSRRYYESNGYEIATPTFQLDEYGTYHIRKEQNNG